MKLAKWFENRIKKVMKHNGYDESMVTSSACNELGYWSPCDLIAREWLNNGGGSAKGFLGLTKAECARCYDYMVENREAIVAMGLVSERAWNNCGFALWNDYQF